VSARWQAILRGLWLAVGLGAAAGAAAESTGALLYSTHCIACHSQQVHWREGRRVTNWADLQAEVRRWQANLRLAWTDDDVAAVARHLNALYYHFPAAGRVAARLPRARRAAPGERA
jgi:hypothetical protein